MDQKLNSHLEPLGNGIEIFVSDEHRFGTDAVLLADFAEAKMNDRAADLGTGCGIIPFLWCRSNPPKEIYAVDIQPQATALCEKSNEKNKLSLKIINSDIRELSGKIPMGSLSLVTCNPPYKASGAGIESKSEAERTARHEISGSLGDFIATASRLLQTSGRFCMCLRPERLSEALNIMSKNSLEPKRLRLVSKNAESRPWLFLVEGKKCAKIGLTVLPNLFIHKPDGSVSDEMEKIYGCYRDTMGAK